MFYIKIIKVVELVGGGSIINGASASCYVKLRPLKKSAKHFSLSTFSTVALFDNLVTFEFVSAWFSKKYLWVVLTSFWTMPKS